MKPLPAILLLFSACVSGAGKEEKSIRLIPQDKTMYCNIRVPGLGLFVLTVPEDIGSAEGHRLAHAERTNIRWSRPDGNGVVSTALKLEERISYRLTLTPGPDYVDARMTLHNLSKEDWTRVWSFNCLAPVKAPAFRDSKLERTYISIDGKPVLLSNRPRVEGPRKTVGVYYHRQVEGELPFVRNLQATNRDRTDDSWIVTRSADGASYMAATSPDALFLFDNQALCCLHSAAHFGDIGAGESMSVTCRFYFARGTLKDFQARFKKER